MVLEAVGEADQGIYMSVPDVSRRLDVVVAVEGVVDPVVRHLDIDGKRLAQADVGHHAEPCRDEILLLPAKAAPVLVPAFVAEAHGMLVACAEDPDEVERPVLLVPEEDVGEAEDSVESAAYGIPVIGFAVVGKAGVSAENCLEPSSGIGGEPLAELQACGRPELLEELGIRGVGAPGPKRPGLHAQEPVVAELRLIQQLIVPVQWILPIGNGGVLSRRGSEFVLCECSGNGGQCHQKDSQILFHWFIN